MVPCITWFADTPETTTVSWVVVIGHAVALYPWVVGLTKAGRAAWAGETRRTAASIADETAETDLVRNVAVIGCPLVADSLAILLLVRRKARRAIYRVWQGNQHPPIAGFRLRRVCGLLVERGDVRTTAAAYLSNF
jgi:hypothetical protein